MCAPRWLKLSETGKLLKHILIGTLCDQIGQNLVIRLEKKLLCRECSSLCIFSVVSVILKHHKQLRVEEDGRLTQEKELSRAFLYLVNCARNQLSSFVCKNY